MVVQKSRSTAKLLSKDETRRIASLKPQGMAW